MFIHSALRETGDKWQQDIYFNSEGLILGNRQARRGSAPEMLAAQVFAKDETCRPARNGARTIHQGFTLLSFVANQVKGYDTCQATGFEGSTRHPKKPQISRRPRASQHEESAEKLCTHANVTRMHMLETASPAQHACEDPIICS